MGLEGDGERGRNRTFNLLIADNQARTEALCTRIEKKRVSAYGIGWYGTLTAHLRGHGCR
jgi:hypothetical protein